MTTDDRIVAWIANDPDGGPYLTWSKDAAHNYPNPQALCALLPKQEGVVAYMVTWSDGAVSFSRSHCVPTKHTTVTPLYATPPSLPLLGEAVQKEAHVTKPSPSSTEAARTETARARYSLADIIDQHIGWIKFYAEGMSAANWRDRQLYIERQIDALSDEFDRLKVKVPTLAETDAVAPENVGQPKSADGPQCNEQSWQRLSPAWQPDRICDDCPPVGYSTDRTRCLPCPRREESGGDA